VKKGESKPAKNVANISPQLLSSNARCFMMEKIQDKGEDAFPLIDVKNNRAVIAVCDGLGGAGSQTVQFDAQDSVKTKAYFASREAISITNAFFKPLLKEHKFAIDDKLFGKLEERIKSGLKQLEKRAAPSKSRLKSRLLKSFPTTISGFVAEVKESECIIHNFWAGDSRNYCLSPKEGLQQLTQDDLIESFDPFENLNGDSRISNFLSADHPFTLNYSRVEIKVPSIVFSSTDGAYDYLPTPMHFEFLILETLLASKDLDGFNEDLKEKLKDIPIGDDVSFGFIIVGWVDFAQLKEAYKNRFLFLKENFIDIIREKQNELKALEKQKQCLEESISEHKKNLEKLKLNSWKNYGDKYSSNIVSEKYEKGRNS